MTLSRMAFDVMVWLAILSSALLMVFILGRFFVELKKNDLW